jgi:hypothetical protein
MINPAWIRENVEKNLAAIYGLRNPTDNSVEKMVDDIFNENPVLQFPGFMELNPLFGCFQGTFLVKDQLKRFYKTVDVVNFEKQYTVVDGFASSAHCLMELKFKESGATYEFELVALVDLDFAGKIKHLKLYFDTASFLKAVNTKNGSFKDARGTMPHPDFNPDSPVKAGPILAGLYNLFYQVLEGTVPWETLYDKFSEGMETVFKSNTDVLPYAGVYPGNTGFEQWINDLFSIWSLNAFNFTGIYTQGNVSDFMMHELHYYNNPDGSKRYLDVYIVQHWMVDDNGKICLFKSYNDSAWLDETFFASEVYKAHYGYPANYAK